ncbi:MAG: hypothetical protein V2J42_05925 [Wenzhouxiangella sp.]|jgi:hypothetical protein|nr:hypothetical protein [Wenzhouxiangella sp.]
MTMSKPAPVMVQRGLLLDGQRAPDSERIAELVAFQRSGHRVLLLARQPQSWRPTRNSMDTDLGLQQQLHQAVRRAGAELDGTLYLATGLFARRQSRTEELTRAARRYGVETGQLIAVGDDETLLESIVQSGGRALNVGSAQVVGASQHRHLQAALLALG